MIRFLASLFDILLFVLRKIWRVKTPKERADEDIQKFEEANVKGDTDTMSAMYDDIADDVCDYKDEDHRR